MSLPEDFMLRPATLADAETIQAQRDAMFADMGSEPAAIQALSAASLSVAAPHARRRRLSGACCSNTAGQVVAGAGVHGRTSSRAPQSPSSVRAYLQNVYVAPAAAGAGLGRTPGAGICWPSASRAAWSWSVCTPPMRGGPPIPRLGFAPTNEMRLLSARPPREFYPAPGWACRRSRLPRGDDGRWHGLPLKLEPHDGGGLARNLVLCGGFLAWTGFV